MFYRVMKTETKFRSRNTGQPVLNVFSTGVDGVFSSSEWSSVELNVPLSHADVVLADGLRRRMAVEQRSGELEPGLEMRMTHPLGLR